MFDFEYNWRTSNKTRSSGEVDFRYGDCQGGFVYLGQEDIGFWYNGNDKNFNERFGQCDRADI